MTKSPVILLLGAKSAENPLEAVPAEVSRLKALFDSSSLPFTVEYEPYLTRSGLGGLLRKHTDQIAIIHFAGHSSSQALMTNDEAVYSQHIAAVIATWEQKPALAFLNGCSNATQVKGFHAAGLPCVLATQKQIDDRMAADFSREFYAELLNQPDRTSLMQAYKRAGALVFMGNPRQPRSIDLDAMDETDDTWDWGLYTLPEPVEDLPQWTLNRLIKPFTVAENPTPQKESTTPDSFAERMRRTKLKNTQERWQINAEHLQRLKQERERTTSEKEKIRQDYDICEKEELLQRIESEIAQLERGISSNHRGQS